MSQFYVYIHKKPDGTPFYVGKGKGNRAYQFSKRNQWHKNIVSKYGKENIIIEITDCESEAQAFDLEKIYIKQLKIIGNELVNLTDGGEGVSGLKRGHPSDDHKRKNALARIGKKQSDETRAKRSESLKGKKRPPRSLEWCKKLSIKTKGRTSPNKGKTLSETHRKNISLAKTSCYLQLDKTIV